MEFNQVIDPMPILKYHRAANASSGANLDVDFQGFETIDGDDSMYHVDYEQMEEHPNPFKMPTLTCGILMVWVTVVGVPCNILTAYVYSRRTMGSASIGVLLTGLAIIEASLLVVSAPIFASAAIYSYRPNIRLMCFLAYMNAYVYPFAAILQTASVWLMTVATLERYLAVCRPFVARKFNSKTRARRVVFLVLAISILYNGCRFWEYKLQRTKAGAVIALPRLRQNETYIKIYVNWMYFAFIFALPFLVLSCVGGLVSLTIRRARLDRQHLTRQQRKEHATATMMVIVGLVYLICNSLAFVLNAMELWGVSGVHEVELPDDLPQTNDMPGLDFDPANYSLELNQTDYDHIHVDNASTTYRHSYSFYFLIDLNNLLVMIHCSLNFVIYFKFSQRFRAHVLSIMLNRRMKCQQHIVDGLTVDVTGDANYYSTLHLTNNASQRQGQKFSHTIQYQHAQYQRLNSSASKQKSADSLNKANCDKSFMLSPMEGRRQTFSISPNGSYVSAHRPRTQSATRSDSRNRPTSVLCQTSD